MNGVSCYACADVATPVLDIDTLDRVRIIASMEREDTFRGLVVGFLQHAQRTVDALRTALSTGDLAPMERLAHTLKATSTVLGAVRLSAQCDALEAVFSQDSVRPRDNPLALGALVDAIGAELRLAEKELSAATVGA